MKLVSGPLFASILLVLLATPVVAQSYPTGADPRHEIADLIERTQAANNAGDVHAWASLFSDDAVYMAPGTPAVSGREALLEVARAGFRNQASVDIEPLEIQVEGSWAFARNRVTGSVKLAGSGDVVTVDVKQIVIYRRSAEGRWQIARLISNSSS